MFLLLNDPVLLSSASIKQNYFAKIFSKISDLDDSNISSLVFPSRTYLKLHNISVSPKMVQKMVQTLIHTSWNFHICLKVSCFPDCWKVSSVVPVLKNVGERHTARSYCPVSLLSVVSKVFEKLVNNRIVDRCCSLIVNCLTGLRLLDLYRMIYPSLLMGVCHNGLLHKRKFYGFSGYIFGLSSFCSNRRFWVVLNGTSSQ